MPPITPPRPRRARTRLRLAARLGLPAVVAAQTLALSAVLASASAAPTAPSAGAVPAAAPAAVTTADGSDDSFTVVQANLLSPQSDAGFRGDVATVYAQSPDLITFNEVAFRKDDALAPAGYELWRTRGQYTGPTPVAWRSSAWVKEDQGTFQISDYAPRPPGRKTQLGMRFANWVTLRSRTQGRVLSVVSAHIAPPVDGMPDLLNPSMERLSQLVTTLGERGPVVVGGDFNVHTRSKRYPAAALAAAGMRSTYEMTGVSFPTGDHKGATIDYVFVRGDDQVDVTGNRPVELNSDHKAVVAEMSWSGVPLVRPLEVRNRPNGTTAQRRVVVETVLGAIRRTTAGETVSLAGHGTTLPSVRSALAAAQRRGVGVQVVTRSVRLTAVEERLRRAAQGRPGSWVAQCLDRCAASWSVDHLASVVMVSGSDGAPRTAVEASRRLRTAMITRPARAVTVTDAASLSALRAQFRRR